ncbi:ESPR-type extended signal peptide-containing protein [Escherichia coli]|nr:ESPR-type extended signal peptide-containing protein [Escherichia coli]MDY3640052.1 ESPR-type extended signal peptide-containing protein [Escherichia coli]
MKRHLNTSYRLVWNHITGTLVVASEYSAAIFLIPICISFDTAEKRRYATYLILNRRFSFEF